MTTTAHTNLLIAVLVAIVTLVYSAKLPSYITPCSRSDPDLNACAVRNGQAALPTLLKGDKNYKIPNLIPLKIDNVAFDAGNNLRIGIKNIEINGFESTHIEEANMDVKNKHLSFLVTIPRINLIGEYSIKGRILVLPIQGEGPANITFVGGRYTYDMDYKLETKEDGLRYVVITGHNLKYATERSWYRLDNLFNGDPILGEEMNKFLNENWKEVNKELGPALSETISQIITKLLMAILSRVPYDNFYTE